MIMGSSSRGDGAVPASVNNPQAPEGVLHPTAGGGRPFYPQFLPNTPGQYATGLTPQMFADIQRSDQGATMEPPAAQGGGLNDLATQAAWQQQMRFGSGTGNMPLNLPDKMSPLWANRAQQTASGWNRLAPEKQTLAGYLQTRDQLAKLMQGGRGRRAYG
jgi:hypothetical protein